MPDNKPPRRSRLAPLDETDEHGFVGVNNTLSPQRILLSYRLGIFPWPMPDGIVGWFTPDPRMVLFLDEVRVSRSLWKVLQSGRFRVSLDQDFEEVIDACASVPRYGQNGTWITEPLRDAFVELHHQGHAHSVEVWEGEELVGGLYGLVVGGVFCGESMFHRVNDASKVAFVTLAHQLRAWGFGLLDCQLHTRHLESLGARQISRDAFTEKLVDFLQELRPLGPWTLEIDPATIARSRGRVDSVPTQVQLQES